jgi:polyisoprenoid-binding protein YceI
MTAIAPDATAAGVRRYSVDPAHSSVGFSIRHLLIAHVHGAFSGISGALNYDPADKETSSVDITIDATTLSTGNSDRDAHVKSADMLDVATFPTIKFISTAIDPGAGDAGEIVGNLTIKGITKQVTLAVDEESDEIKDPMGNLRMAFVAHTKIKRSDYGVTFNMPLDTGGLALGDDLKVTIDVQFIRKT